MIKKIMSKINDIAKKNDETMEMESPPNADTSTGSVSESSVAEALEATNESPSNQLEIDLSEAQDRYLRLSAEFDNFRKRNQKDRFELIKSASESVILSLLPILDDFDRALSEISDETTKSGVELIFTKLKNVLENQGLKTMETQGVEFNPDLHEAVAQTPVNDEKEKGLIINEIQRGYYLNDKVIRHAKVIVGC
jgi:molecular chaperone GrpE